MKFHIQRNARTGMWFAIGNTPVRPCYLLDNLIQLILEQHGPCTCIVEVAKR
jgi:hypothetical protein